MSLELLHIHLCFALLIFMLLPLRRRTPLLQGMTLLALLALGFVPVGELPLAIYLRTVLPEPSVVGLLGLTWAALVRLRLADPLAPRQRLTLLVVFGMLGLCLYPAALGLGPFDPYRLGFSPRPMIIVAGLLTLLLLLLRNLLGVLMLTLATLAFSFGILASTNYWDYLLDPFVVLYCWLALIGYGVRKLRRSGSEGLVR